MMKFDYKYALLDSSWLIPFAIFSVINFFTTSKSILVGCIIALAVLYYFYHIKILVPLKKKYPSFSEINRIRQQPFRYIWVVMFPLILLGSAFFTSIDTWFFPVIFFFKFTYDGLSKANN